MSDSEIAHNRSAHDRLGDMYDGNHPEIFNEIEQARLANALGRALTSLGAAQTGPVRALDVGCGTGNLSRHLLNAGVHVTGADLSIQLLAEASRRFVSTGRFETLPLNGRDLQPVPDGTYDLVATYSVLHHVSDYCALVAEMVRVTRPGGVIFIDHERSEESWSSESYCAFLRDAVVRPRRRWWYLLQPERYWNRLRPLLVWRRWLNARWMPEGDLHIWPDDHIEWSRIKRVLLAANCHIVVDEAYLLYEPRFDRGVWKTWHTRTSDMQLLVSRRAI